MSLTSLNLPAPPKAVRPSKLVDVCPSCGAKSRKITVESFGVHTQSICEHCGYEYKD